MAEHRQDMIMWMHHASCLPSVCGGGHHVLFPFDSVWPCNTPVHGACLCAHAIITMLADACVMPVCMLLTAGAKVELL